MTDDEETKDALVVVPDDQLSLAIGREGQNVRLAHRLTGWKIDIKSVSQMETKRLQELQIMNIMKKFKMKKNVRLILMKFKKKLKKK